jgi:serine/threonine protein kinase
MKLLMENWRRFITEETDATGAMPAHLDTKKIEAANQELLNQQGHTILRELGRGYYGVVYEVQNEQTGERLAAKVVRKSDRETENYEFAMKNKASMPPEYAKYLPEVKEIIPGASDRNIIFMELLKPLPDRVAQELFAMEDEPDASQKTEKILKSPEAVAELVGRIVNNNRILNQMRDFLVNREKVTKAAVSAATKSPHSDPEGLLRVVYGAVVRELEFQSVGVYKSFEKTLKSDMTFYLSKQVVPVHQPEPDDPDDLWTGPAMAKTQDLFPEAENLMKAMKYFMQDQNWQPKDVHIKNVMMRPATNDFVIVDLGLFQKGIFE